MRGDRMQLVGAGEADRAFQGDTAYPPVNSPWGGVHFATLVIVVVIFLLVLGSFIGLIICCIRQKHKLDDIHDKLGVQVCGIGCKPIKALPAYLKNGCHYLKFNFTWTVDPGAAITISDGHQVDLCFNHNQIELSGENVGVHITNGSTQARVHDARLFAAVQTTSFFTSRGILVDGCSSAELLNGYIRNLGIGVRTDGLASVTVRNYKIFGEALADVEFFRAIGVDCFNSVECNVYDTYVHIPQLVPVANLTTFDVASFGFVVRRTLANLDAGIGRAHFENVEADRCTVGAYLRQTQYALVRHARITGNAIFTANALQVGSSSQGNADVVDIYGLEISLEDGTPSADGLLIMNARSVHVDGVKIHGFVEPVFGEPEGNYRGAHITIGNFFANYVIPARLSSITIENADLVNQRMNTPTVQIFGGPSPGNTSVVLRKSHIFGGLAGVLLLEEAAAVSVEDVTVTNATYCFAATNKSQASEFISDRATRCCVGYFFDETTHENAMIGNRAMQTGFAVIDNGAGNVLNAPHSTAENGNCEPPSLAFSIGVDVASAAWMSAKFGGGLDEPPNAAAAA